MRTQKRTWVRLSKLATQSKLRLFCFPYAGGRSQVFRDWIGAFSNGIEVCAVRLPGESIIENCVSSLEDLVPILADGLRPYLDGPFAFFGHSMGALIAYELLRHLQRSCGARAVHLFVSARSAPGLPAITKPLYDLPQAELIAELKLLNGTPHELLENGDLIELLLPRLRADFQLNETYQYKPGESLQCGITAYGGTEDPHVRPEEILEWRKYTTGAFNFQLLPGDHFFLHTRQAELLDSISASLAPHLCGTTP